MRDAAFGGIGDLPGDIEDRLGAADLDRLGVDRRVVNAFRGIGLDLGHLVRLRSWGCSESPEQPREYSVISANPSRRKAVRKLFGVFAAVILTLMLFSPPAEARCWWNGYRWH